MVAPVRKVCSLGERPKDEASIPPFFNEILEKQETIFGVRTEIKFEFEFH